MNGLRIAIVFALAGVLSIAPCSAFTEWKTREDKAIARELEAAIAQRERVLLSQEYKIRKRIERLTRKNTDKEKAELLQEKLADILLQRDCLIYLSKGMEELEESATPYTFNTLYYGAPAFLSSLEDGTIVINNYGKIGNRAHEVTHAIQYERGDFSFTPLGSNKIQSDRYIEVLEIQAYRSEFTVTGGMLPVSKYSKPKTIAEISYEWLYGL